MKTAFVKAKPVSFFKSVIICSLAICFFQNNAAATSGVFWVYQDTMLSENHNGVIVFQVGGVRLDLAGHNVNGPGYQTGILSQNLSGIEIVGPGIISNFSTGINIEGGSGNYIYNEVVTNCINFGVLLVNTSNVTLGFCRLNNTDNYDGVAAVNSSNIHIIDSDLNCNNRGGMVSYGGGSDHTVERSNVNANSTSSGLTFSGILNPKVITSRVQRNGPNPVFGHGIALYNSLASEIYDNELIAYNGCFGVYFDYTSEQNIYQYYNNDFQQNGCGDDNL